MLSLMLTLVAQVQELPNVPKPSAAALSHASPTPSMTWRSTAPAAVLRAQAAAELGRAIERSPGNAQAWPDLRAAAVLAAATLGAESQNAARITRAVLAADEKEARKESKAALSDLSAELGLVSRDLVFAPLVESPRPLGFPDATVVGEFEVLAYPAYRMARTAMPRSLFGQQNSAFWKLFQHIQSHGIPMTAPVEMSWGESTGDSSEAGRNYESMAFLYVSTDVGTTGPDGEVDVHDVPAATVVSVGVRGASGEQRVREQRERLRAWIEARPDRLEIVGPPRMMGWNSPMVPDAKRYWEVQFPVRVLEPAPSRAK